VRSDPAARVAADVQHEFFGRRHPSTFLANLKSNREPEQRAASPSRRRWLATARRTVSDSEIPTLACAGRYGDAEAAEHGVRIAIDIVAN
jgi:hypothetical protein